MSLEYSTISNDLIKNNHQNGNLPFLMVIFKCYSHKLLVWSLLVKTDEATRFE